LKKQLPEELCEKFLKEYELDRQKIIESVYKRPAANRFLASLSPFLSKNIEEPAIHRLVLNAFKSFFVRNIENYKDYKNYAVSFVGSVAFYYREVLEEAAKAVDIKIGTIIKSPMEGLVKYHSN
ncbi:MAG: ATPase, partial [Bacteroidales bacterium]|nr:ATPase [Bacteroidales bacterium]